MHTTACAACVIVTTLIAGVTNAETATPVIVLNPSGVPTRSFDQNGRATNTNPTPSATVATAVGGVATPTAGALQSSSSPNPTIDNMTTSSYGTYLPGTGLNVIGQANTYSLSDGSSWQSGAGSFQVGYATLDHVVMNGTTVQYFLTPPANGVLYQQTDFDSGNHSAQGSLGASAPLVLEATLGSTTAVLQSGVTVLSNDETWYGTPRFNFYSAIVGAVVPVTVTYQLSSGTWGADTLGSSFSYSATGQVDFANPLNVPKVVGATIFGSAEVPSSSSVQFAAVASYDNGASKSITDLAQWSVAPSDLASIVQGLLTVGGPETAGQGVTVHISYTENGSTVTADKSVQIVAPGADALSAVWPMYQVNPRHTGSLSVSFDPTEFTLRWQRTLATGHAVNPVTVADGKVFASLVVYFDKIPQFFALDSRDGSTLWSKTFTSTALGGVFSVNPPAYAYGNVYVQTCNNGGDTWLRAFDANTGAVVFQSPHQAQWERYYAPTIFQGSVYVDGGEYGGMYAFDAFSGQELWFAWLPQYDEWTPAVDQAQTYAYVGEYAPGLYVFDRSTGTQLFMIPDPGFQWNGWSMQLAPVLGDFGEVLAIHDGRLISFDLTSRTIGWQQSGGFAGQPTISGGEIYAASLNGLQVLDEAKGQPIWSWTPPSGEMIQGSLVVTNTDVFVSTNANVYAIDLLSHQSVWSFAGAGRLAIGDNSLYIASDNGTLTAISLSKVCDVDGNGIVDQVDIQLIADARGTPASGPNDPRDADHDGMITVLDDRQCTLQCTYTLCASTAPPPITTKTPSQGQSCGMLGAEPALGVAVLLWLRRRRGSQKSNSDE
jgi:outer membrane protein assembly factor BamB